MFYWDLPDDVQAVAQTIAGAVVVAALWGLYRIARAMSRRR